MRRQVIVLAVVSLAAPTLAADLPDWRPTMRQAIAAEGKLVLPPGAYGPVDTYTRYYAGSWDHGHRVLVGELVRLTKAPADIRGIKIVRFRQMPAYADFGCGVITYTFDPRTRVATKAACQGETPQPPPPGTGD